MIAKQTQRTAITTLLGVCLASCTGVIEDAAGQRVGGTGNGAAAGRGNDSGNGAGTGIGGGGSGGDGMGTGGTPPQPTFVPEAAGLRRLTIPQYQNSVRDVLGIDVAITTEFEGDTMLSGFASIGAARVGLSAKLVEQFETLALSVAKLALSNVAGRPALVGCNPAGTTDDSCTRQFIQKLGRRAWRRPLVEAEISQLEGIAKNAQTVLNDFFGGLQYAVAAILQSPHFLYREELGSPDPSEPSRRSFNDHELAVRMAYFLWNTTPDEQLLDAADAGQLTQGGGLFAHAERLLGSERAASAMQVFFSEFYRLGELDALPQLASLYPQLTLTLGASMRTETLLFLNDVAFGRQGDFRAVFDSRDTFVNAELAGLYGVTAPTGTAFAAVTLPDTGMRAGILGHASFLASSSQPNRSSPTRRGKFIREMLLCQHIPEPPPDIAPFPDAAQGTAREKLASHGADPCAGCHALMDPIGLGLENFDGIGAFRTTDEGRPIDASGELDGVTFEDPRNLATAVKNHPDLPACIARNVYRYAVAHVESAGEEVAITTLTNTFRENGFRFRSLLEGMINSPAFVYAAHPEN